MTYKCRSTDIWFLELIIWKWNTGRIQQRNISWVYLPLKSFYVSAKVFIFENQQPLIYKSAAFSKAAHLIGLKFPNVITESTTKNMTRSGLKDNIWLYIFTPMIIQILVPFASVNAISLSSINVYENYRLSVMYVAHRNINVKNKMKQIVKKSV